MQEQQFARADVQRRDGLARRIDAVACGLGGGSSPWQVGAVLREAGGQRQGNPATWAGTGARS